MKIWRQQYTVGKFHGLHRSHIPIRQSSFKWILITNKRIYCKEKTKQKHHPFFDLNKKLCRMNVILGSSNTEHPFWMVSSNLILYPCYPILWKGKTQISLNPSRCFCSDFQWQQVEIRFFKKVLSNRLFSFAIHGIFFPCNLQYELVKQIKHERPVFIFFHVQS